MQPDSLAALMENFRQLYALVYKSYEALRFEKWVKFCMFKRCILFYKSSHLCVVVALRHLYPHVHTHAYTQTSVRARVHTHTHNTHREKFSGQE